jgi:hypothetical protein
VRGDGIRQRIGADRGGLQDAARHRVEQPGAELAKARRIAEEMAHARPAHRQRAFQRQRHDIERRHVAGRIAIVHDHAERRHAVERLFECVEADAVEHGVDALGRDALGRCHEINLAIEDRVIAAVILGDAGLLGIADGADDSRAEMLGPLHQQKPDAARRRMDQHGVAGLRPVDAVDDARRGQALEHQRSGLPVGDGGGQFHQPAGWNVALLRIRAGVGPEIGARAAIADPVAGRDLGHAAAKRRHHARRLVAEDHRHRQRLLPVEAAAPHVDVGEVDRDGGVPHARLAGARRRQFDLFEAHDLGAAVDVDANGFDHGSVASTGGR